MIAENEFRKQIDRFYNEVLSQYGYAKPEQVDDMKPLSGEGLQFKFEEPRQNLRIWIHFFKLMNGGYSMQFSMFEMIPNSKFYDKVFFLDDYKRQSEFKKIVSKSEPGQDPEQFARTYFDSLIDACQTHLREQISGASFEEHPKYPSEM